MNTEVNKRVTKKVNRLTRTIMIRDVPLVLAQEFKSITALKGTSMNKECISMISDFVDKNSKLLAN